jgi:hypothetical protein
VLWATFFHFVWVWLKPLLYQSAIVWFIVSIDWCYLRVVIVVTSCFGDYVIRTVHVIYIGPGDQHDRVDALDGPLRVDVFYDHPAYPNFHPVSIWSTAVMTAVCRGHCAQIN